MSNYQIPEHGMPEFEYNAENVGFIKSAEYYGLIKHENNDFLDGFISGSNWQASQSNPAIAVIEAEKKRITEAMKVRSTNFDNIELNLLNRLLSKYNEQSI